MKTLINAALLRVVWAMRLLILFVIVIYSCSEDDKIPLPVKPGDGPSQQPGDSTANPPQNPPPDSIPGNQQPDPVPGNPPPYSRAGDKVKKIAWDGGLDYYTFDYNADGLVSKLTSQWVIAMRTNHVQKELAHFIYDGQKKLIEIRYDNQGVVKYDYQGEKLVKSQEYAPASNLLATFYYAFDTQNRLIEARTVKMDTRYDNVVKYEAKHVYEYDTRGNNTVVKEFVKNSSTGIFEFSLSQHFEGFDTYKYINNIMAFLRTCL